MKKKDEIAVVHGSENVFADIGMPRPEEALAKAQLAVSIKDAIASLGLSRAEAAALLKIDEPKVSMMVRGRLKDFSLERLMRFLKLLNRDVSIVIREHGEKRIEREVQFS